MDDLEGLNFNIDFKADTNVKSTANATTTS